MTNQELINRAFEFSERTSTEPVEWEIKSFHNATVAVGEFIPYVLRISPYRIVMEASKKKVLESIVKHFNNKVPIEVRAKLNTELDTYFEKIVWLTPDVDDFEEVKQQAEEYILFHRKRLIDLATKLLNSQELLDPKEKAQASLNLTF